MNRNLNQITIKPGAITAPRFESQQFETHGLKQIQAVSKCLEEIKGDLLLNTLQFDTMLGISIGTVVLGDGHVDLSDLGVLSPEPVVAKETEDVLNGHVLGLDQEEDGKENHDDHHSCVRQSTYTSEFKFSGLAGLNDYNEFLFENFLDSQEAGKEMIAKGRMS